MSGHDDDLIHRALPSTNGFRVDLDLRAFAKYDPNQQPRGFRLIKIYAEREGHLPFNIEAGGKIFTRNTNPTEHLGI